MEKKQANLKTFLCSGTTGAGVLSTICHNQELNQTFSLAPSSAVYNISSPVDLTSGCLNKTVVSGLAWRSSKQQEREIEVTVCSEPPPGCALEHCSWSRWLNKPRQNFSMHSLPKPWVLRGLLSHSVRRWANRTCVCVFVCVCIRVSCVCTYVEIKVCERKDMLHWSADREFTTIATTSVYNCSNSL